jgi:hypothetical protein
MLVVNLVMATDIFDNASSTGRTRRWERTFTRSKNKDLGFRDKQATLVLDHLMQASDVAHTMQHWNVYIKWNRRLFKERYENYRLGHGKSDPAESWFEGEMKFFDTFVIPLAHKLMECGVFGDASEEYLNYAKANRRDWQVKGREVIMDYMSEYRGKKGKIFSPNFGHSSVTNNTLWSSNSSINRPSSVTWNDPTSENRNQSSFFKELLE